MTDTIWRCMFIQFCAHLNIKKNYEITYSCHLEEKLLIKQVVCGDSIYLQVRKSALVSIFISCHSFPLSLSIILIMIIGRMLVSYLYHPSMKFIGHRIKDRWHLPPAIWREASLRFGSSALYPCLRAACPTHRHAITPYAGILIQLLLSKLPAYSKPPS